MYHLPLKRYFSARKPSLSSISASAAALAVIGSPSAIAGTHSVSARHSASSAASGLFFQFVCFIFLFSFAGIGHARPCSTVFDSASIPQVYIRINTAAKISPPFTAERREIFHISASYSAFRLSSEYSTSAL